MPSAAAAAAVVTAPPLEGAAAGVAAGAAPAAEAPRAGAPGTGEVLAGVRPPEEDRMAAALPAVAMVAARGGQGQNKVDVPDDYVDIRPVVCSRVAQEQTQSNRCTASLSGLQQALRCSAGHIPDENRVLARASGSVVPEEGMPGRQSPSPAQLPGAAAARDA